MNTSPLVSVLMTVYNREKYIAAAIESVLASTYTNFELIIVDDQSQDESVQIAKRYEAEDERIKLYVNDKNLGDYPNRNKAASYAKGKYLKFLDADDLIYPYGLETMVLALEKHSDSALGLSHSIVDDVKPYPFEVTSHDAYREHFLGTGLFNYGPSALIFKKEIFELEKGFTGERYIGDTEILLRIGAKYPIVKMAPALVWWRQHDGQEISKGNSSGYYLINTYKLNLLMLNNSICPLNEPLKKKAIRRQKQHHARKLLTIGIKQRNPKVAFTAWKRSGLTFLELLKGFKRYE